MKQIDEEVLIKGAKNGDKECFRELVLLYQDQAYRIAYRMMGNQEDAKDATQESFIKIYRSLHTFKEESNFSTWMYRIVNNTCLDLLRKRKRRKEIPIEGTGGKDGEEYEIPIEDPGDGPEVLLQAKSLQEAMKIALWEISEEYRTAVILRDLEQFSYQEIAEIMKISQGTVKSRINRGRIQLREKLTAYLEE